jgi:hypothetical protein
MYFFPSVPKDSVGRPSRPSTRGRFGRPVRREEVGDVDTERGGNPLERGDARVRTAALDLAQEALGQPRAVGDRLERYPPKPADLAERLSHVDVHRLRLRDQRLDVKFRYLHAHRRRLKRH